MFDLKEDTSLFSIFKNVVEWETFKSFCEKEQSFFPSLPSRETVDLHFDPYDKGEEGIHYRVPAWKRPGFTIPTYHPPKPVDTNVQSISDEVKSKMLTYFDPGIFRSNEARTDHLLRFCMVPFCIQFNMGLKCRKSANKRVFSCLTDRCPFQLHFGYEDLKWRFQSEECKFAHFSDCSSTFIHKNYFIDLLFYCDMIKDSLLFSSKPVATIASELISTINEEFESDSLATFLKDNEDQLCENIIDLRTQFENIYEKDRLLNGEVSTIIENSMNLGFSTIYTCMNDGDEWPNKSQVKDIFVVYSSGMNYFIDGKFSTVGLHTTYDKTMEGRNFICHIVGLDDSNNSVPLLTGYLTDEAVTTYVSLLQAFFYSFYNLDFKVTFLKEVWNLDFQCFFYKENKAMPIKTLLIEPDSKVNNALKYFPFFHSSAKFDLKSVIKMHLQESFELDKLKFMDQEKNLLNSVQTPYILVKFCSWNTTIQHIQTFSGFFEAMINVDNHSNLETLHKMDASENFIKQEQNKDLHNTTDFPNYEVGFEKTNILNREVLDLAALYHKLKNHYSVIEPVDMIEFIGTETTRIKELLSCFSNIMDVNYSAMRTPTYLIKSNDIHDVNFDMTLETKYNSKDYTYTCRDYYFLGDVESIFEKYGEKISAICSRVFGHSSKISFGLLSSKISRMMNTSSLEEGLDLFLSIIWCLTRMDNGEQIFDFLKQNVFHEQHRYRFCFFLGNLLKLSVLNNLESEIEDPKIPISYSRSKFFIHTYHNNTFNAAFARTWVSEVPHETKKKGLVGIVSHYNSVANAQISKTIESRFNYRHKIAKLKFVDEEKLFYHLKNGHSTISDSSIDKIRKTICHLRERVYKICLSHGSLSSLYEKPEFHERLNDMLVKEASESCTKFCFIIPGVPCEHVLLKHYLYAKIVYKSGGVYRIHFALKKCLQPNEYFYERSFNKLFDKTVKSDNFKFTAYNTLIDFQTKENIKKSLLGKKLVPQYLIDLFLGKNRKISRNVYSDVEGFIEAVMDVAPQRVPDTNHSIKRSFSTLQMDENL